MKVPRLYERIVSNSEITKILAWPYDFEVVEPYSIALEFNLITDEEAIIIAKDGTGGLFVLWGNGQVEHLPIVYVSSEGQAGKIAKNFNEVISILILCPFWRDLLKFSSNGQLSEMNRVFPLFERIIIEDYPEIEYMKEKIILALSLDIMDPVEKLFEAVVSKPRIILKAEDGESLEGLFHSFVWR